MLPSAASESRTSGVLWVAAGAALWGTDTVLRRPLAEVLPPLHIVFYEHLLLAVVVAPILIRQRSFLRKITLKEWWAVLGVAWIGSALATLLFTYSVRSGNPTTAVLLQKLQPVFAIALARGLLGERWHSTFPAVAAVSLGGAYLISFGGQDPWDPFSHLNAVASLLALGAAAGWGSATILGRVIAPKIPFHLLTGLRIVCALPVLTLAVLPQSIAVPSRTNLPPLIALALIPGFAGLLLYYRGLRETPASQATLAELAFPATAAVLNWVVLGAGATALQILGFAVVWSSIFYLRQKL
ncbi:MAG: EamA family transporter [Acidobacteria bacterium]|nr:EamA family transporter [Acidobacteriota bacterium]